MPKGKFIPRSALDTGLLGRLLSGALLGALIVSTAWSNARGNEAKEGSFGPEHEVAPAADSAGVSGGRASSEAAEVGEFFDRDFDRADPWLRRLHIGLGWEIHGLLYKDNYAGNGAETLFNYFYGTLSYDFTDNDRVSLIAGLYQFALVDPTEPAWRADDLVLRYTHHFQLPLKFGLDTAVSAVAPTSFASYKLNLLAEFAARAVVTKTLLRYIHLDARVFGSYYEEGSSTIPGGSSPTPAAGVGGAAGVEVELPIHPQLAAGVNGYTRYLIFNDPSGVPQNQQYGGLETNPAYAHQPWQQEYGLEAFVRYELPRYRGLASTLKFAYAQGDPTFGYTNLQVGGVSNLYLLYPESSQFYFNVDLRY